MTIAPIRLADMTFHKRVVYDVQANWKVYVENFLEGYHVPIVHPELMKMYDFSNYETEVSEYWSLQHSPLTEDEDIEICEHVQRGLASRGYDRGRAHLRSGRTGVLLLRVSEFHAQHPSRPAADERDHPGRSG